MREQVVVDGLVAHAKATGWIPRKMAYRGRRGCRDLDCYGYGQVVMIEAKRPDGGELSALQARERRRLAAAGLIVHVIDSVEEGRALLDRKRG